MSEKPSFQTVTFITVEQDRVGQRLDNFLIGLLKGVPKSRIYRIIRDGQVRVNKKRASQITRLEAGDEVRVPPIRVAEAAAAPVVGESFADALSRALLYEDDELLVYNKPAGLAVHGGSGISLGLIETLRTLRPADTQLELVHRLDRDTSGLIMVARKRSFLRRVQQLLKDGGIEKRYWMLVQGYKGGPRTVTAPLLKLTQSNNERIVRVSREGKESVTHFQLLQRLKNTQLLDALLETGRTHQIRVHAQYSGFPLLGDSKYGLPDLNSRLQGEGFNRLFLHARSLRLRHPDSGQWLTLEAPLDPQFERALAWLSEHPL